MKARVRGYHLPELEDRITPVALDIGGVDVEVPQLTASQLQAAIAAIKGAAMHARQRTLDDILATIDRVVMNWLRPEYGQRRLAEQLLPLTTGYSAEMIRHGLPLLLQPLRAAAVDELLRAELGEQPVQSPALITHVLSGNIPGLAATPMVLSLALRSALLMKSAAGDTVFPALFATSISEVDEPLGRGIAVTHWHGGDRELEEIAFTQAELVVASGSDAAIAAIAARVPGRFIGHGHRVSFAAIGAECLTDRGAARELARRLAYDVCLWDQQGCLSPQLCYIESGGTIRAAEFAELLAEALTHYARELPPRRLSFDEKAAVLRFRQEAEWLRGTGTGLLASRESTDWSISIEANATFLPSCLNRCVRLKVVDCLDEMEAALAPHRAYCEAVGLAATGARLDRLSAMLTRCDVHRICSIGTMQLAPLSWRQGGRPRVGDWIAANAVSVDQ